MSWLKAKDWATGVEYSDLFHSGLEAISGAQVRHTRSPQERTSSSPSRLPRRRATRTRQQNPSTPRESSPVPRRRPRRVTRRRTSSSKDEAWSSQGSVYGIGGFLEEECLRAEYLLPEYELHGLHSGSRAFFVDPEKMDADAVGEASFISLSSDDVSHHRRMPWCEHPSAPRRRESSDSAWTLEESLAELNTGDLGDGREEEVDWRQFHVDWVENIS